MALSVVVEKRKPMVRCTQLRSRRGGARTCGSDGDRPMGLWDYETMGGGNAWYVGLGLTGWRSSPLMLRRIQASKNSKTAEKRVARGSDEEGRGASGSDPESCRCSGRYYKEDAGCYKVTALFYYQPYSYEYSSSFSSSSASLLFHRPGLHHRCLARRTPPSYLRQDERTHRQ